jgi:PTH1 family peptidyl-tRNA hydrolase
MKIIVGLGNPGERYKNTRHNAGFLAVDFILKFDGYMAARPSHEFKSEVHTLISPTAASGQREDGQKIIFLKPQTYMNDSGQALKVICNFYKLDYAKELLVLHDEVDLPFGTYRFTDSSSAAGHNGVKSIIENLGTQDFARIRIGVENRANREQMPTDAFVLQDFTPDELQKLNSDIFPKIKDEVEKFLAL